MKRQRYRIIQAQLRELTRRAVALASTRQREVCGLLLFNGHTLDLLECANAARRRGGFQLRLSDVKQVEMAARRLRWKVVGTFHSHIEWIAEPGPSDIAGAYRSLMLIVDTLDRSARLWRIVGKRAHELKYELV